MNTMSDVTVGCGVVVHCSGLGKKLGKAMGLVAKEVKSMTQSQILDFQNAGQITFSGHELALSDIKVRNFASTVHLFK